MKRLSLLVLLGLLAACQSPSAQLPQRAQNNAVQNLSNSRTPATATTASGPQLNASFLRELEGFDEEGDPSLDVEVTHLDENLIKQTIGTTYV